MRKFDVVVIGAGIHGAGVAQASAAQGWSTAIIERNADVAQETSSRSSKLIHGGLRYLETGQFKLVHECLRERSILLANAKDLVKMVPFYIPIYENAQRGAFWVAVGLFVYNFIAYVSGGKRNGVQLGWQTLSKDKWCELGIKTQGLKYIFQYLDAQTDDAKLTHHVLASAKKLGVSVFFNTVVNRIKNTEEGIELQLPSGETVLSQHVVNAAGPWVNEVAESFPEAPKVELDWVQGTHIILPRVSLSGCIYLEAPQDGRAFFILPWKGQTIVGTTERVLTEPNAQATPEEIQYLLDAYNHYFPDHSTELHDVVSSFAGVRVLPLGKPGTPAHMRPRETVYATQILEYKKTRGVYVGIYGGKLTSYRATANQVIKHIARCKGQPLGATKSTARLPLI